jgi:DNA polymerase-1
LKEIKPTHVAMTFDLAGPTFRHDQYKEYKATRVKAADELYQQIPRCKEVTAALGIPIYEMQGFEADDVLGTLASEIEKENNSDDNYEILIVTGDLDTLQLVDDYVKIYTLRKGLTDVAVYDSAAINERYGIMPSQVIDFKAIKGDPSDNIPGVNGIGEKGALDLIKEFGSIANIYKNLDKLKEKTRKLFEEQKDQVKMSQDLSRIIRDVPIRFSLPSYAFSQIDYQKIIKLFQDLEFRTLIDKLPKIESSKVAATKKNEPLAVLQTSEKKNDKYHLVDTLAKLEKLVAALNKQEEFAFDTETDGLGALEFNLVGISISFKESEAYYVPADILLQNGLAKGVCADFCKVFADGKIRKIAHNIKYDFLALKKFGIKVENLYFDTMIASYLLASGSRSHDLDSLAFNEFGYQMQPIEELIGKGKSQITMREVPVDKACFYSCEDVDFTFRLKNILLPRLQKEKLDKIFFEIEMPLIKSLSQIEENGILLDVKLFKSLEKEVDKQLIELEKRIYKLAGEEFNINSPAQLKVILFEKLNLGPGGVGAANNKFFKKTKTGYSTAASELEKMRGSHQIIEEILNYRELSKLQSTYIKPLPIQINKSDGRLHTSYSQTIAATGRLSSTNPNLQNIPVGSQGIAHEIRKGFIAAAGCKLVAIDYSQIELRVVAHVSGDKIMTEVFKKGEDIHAATAMYVYGLDDPSKVTKEMRRHAKTINFGILYGLSSFGLSERIQEFSRVQAGEFIKRYYETFPSIKAYLESVVQQTKKMGYVENELGRKRYLPEINSSQFQIRAAAERAAINMPMQSLAADIIKIAMNRISEKINVQSDEIKMLLQVHDELVFEIRENKIEQFAPQIKEIMENAYKLTVPLLAEIKSGENWGEMQ